jgi:acid phosphatase family membrane protein YuiD
MRTLLSDLLANQIFLAGFGAWAIAQFIKVPLDYAFHRRVNWGLLISSGGMPSSHSALVIGASWAIGLQEGFRTPLFALAFVLAMVVIYDAMGVRRHAGDHARVLNLMIDELLTGHPLAEKELKEVLGHTPREVVGGALLGLTLAYLVVRVF